jgi:triosephosphate isomerase
MNTRKRIVAGNWKMNLSSKEAKALFEGVKSMKVATDLTVAVFPPMLYVENCLNQTTPEILIGAQNGYPIASGAYTGEVSMQQLASAGVNAVLVGHSERRMLFNEDHELLKAKVNTALENGLIPFFCCGEPLEVRETGGHEAMVKQQLQESLFHLSAEEIVKTVIAYEPVWAIGTGLTASTEQAEEMHAAIRSWLAARYTVEIADQISILYGGSCNPGNAKALFACPNVDGGLIGGASLKVSDFSVLVAEETWTI